MYIQEGEVVGFVDLDKVEGVGGADDISYCFSGGAWGSGGVERVYGGGTGVGFGAAVEDEGGAGAEEEIGLAVDGGDEGFVGGEEEGLERGRGGLVALGEGVSMSFFW